MSYPIPVSHLPYRPPSLLAQELISDLSLSATPPAAPMGASRWRALRGACAVESLECAQWLDSLFGCAAWGTLAGSKGLSAAQECHSAWGQLGHCQLGALRMRRSAASREHWAASALFVWVIESGTLTLELDDGQERQLGAGTVLLSDGSQPLRARWAAASVHHLRLPRHRVAESLGAGVHAPLPGVMELSQLSLARFLSAQMQLLHTQGPSMAEQELDETLALIFGTVDGLLRVALAPRQRVSAAPLSDKLQAVHRYIEKNLHRHDLSVEQIALGVNSSRAQLYRLFEGQDLSVHGTLREARLLKSVEYLRNCGDKSLSIGAIAYACGFSDQSVFSKLFKRRFGLTPSELRQDASLADGPREF